MSEFDLLSRYFTVPLQGASRIGELVALGPGDDCALLDVPGTESLAISTDTQVAGRHFPEPCPAAWVAWRALGAAVSDLAAMGARPVAYLLALTLPDADENWVSCFSDALILREKALGLSRIGGDLTQGPLQVNITVLGLCPKGRALTRHGARVGDDIFVSGTPGLAAAALARLGHLGFSSKPEVPEVWMEAYTQPEPRLRLGQDLRQRANAVIDISDGLAADLNHILDASAVGATLNQEALGLHPVLQQVSERRRLAWVLGGGDDYELCFTAAPSQREAIESLGADTGVRLQRIGSIDKEAGLRLRYPDQRIETLSPSGYQHFS